MPADSTPDVVDRLNSDPATEYAIESRPVRGIRSWERALREDAERSLRDQQNPAALSSAMLDMIAADVIHAVADQLDEIGRPAYAFGRRLRIAWSALTSRRKRAS